MAAPTAKEVAPRHRVLIVDDEESTRLLLAHMLTEDLDVEAQLAGTCEQALKLAGNYAYDAILLDLLMPGVGGLGVLAAIRAASPNANTPVVVVSVVTEDETVKRCMQAGASAYHVKPVRRAELVSIVKAQLAGRGKPQAPR
ncbi:MAG TPA: response regulator [Burkholderiales bacterium]|jgi:adenylate cyclase|nr:response regulator [Burkholderiales bacterium]